MMKNLWYAVLLLLGMSITVSGIAQSNDVPEKKVASEAVEEIDETTYVIVEEMPEFPGGMSALSEFVAKNIKYPQDAIDKGVQGRVYVKFIIEPDGAVSNVAVSRSLEASCDAEAVRVVESMPTWKPGKQYGKAVRVSYTLPVVFRL